MLRRGDVVEIATPSIGFARQPERRLALVLQRDQASSHLPTVIVAPVDDYAVGDPHPTTVVIPAAEARAPKDLVVRVHLLRHYHPSRVGPTRGAASGATMARVAAALRLLLG